MVETALKRDQLLMEKKNIDQYQCQPQSDFRDKEESDNSVHPQAW